MCSIFGAVLNNQINPALNAETNRILQSIYRAAFTRGRDGRGWGVWNHEGGRHEFSVERELDHRKSEPPEVSRTYGCAVVLGNTRAEPTTEYVKHKSLHDQQPYMTGRWAIVHNGTIANDIELRADACNSGVKQIETGIDSAAIVETLAKLDADPALPATDDFDLFHAMVQSLKGSYAILAKTDDNEAIYVAANYRPIWYIQTGFGVFFASTRDAFPKDYVPQMVQPYSTMCFWVENGEMRVHKRLLNPPTIAKHKVLVVCSGGLDSVVSAWAAKFELGHDVELMHFHYGSRAGSPELEAIRKVAEHMRAPLHVKMLPMWDKEDSNLLNPESQIAGGEAGAEFAHEWVPARNLVMLAVATAFAEAKGFTYIVLGNNLEEAGAYPDNEPEFIAKFNDLLPFAVGDGKKVTVIMPVGNMMKHEIVAYGHKIGAPMHLTWSCYRAGEKHCGKCGPCYMRRTAFQINNLPEVIDYEV